MSDNKTLLLQAYSAFNRRDIEGALVLMSATVSWPRASEGGRVVGKAEIRAYWTRQWQAFDPHVEPVEVIDLGAGMCDVRVQQVVRSLDGAILSDTEVWHRYLIEGGLIERMEVAGETETPTSAFTPH